MPDGEESAPNLYHVNLHWAFEPENPDTGAFAMAIVIDEEKVLQGIEIYQRPQNRYLTNSPQQILGQLGTPDHIEVSLWREGVERVGLLAVHLVYFRGIGIRLIYEVWPTVVNDDYSTATYGTVCFDTVPHTTFAFLVPPFDGLTDEGATIPQQEWILDQIGAGRWKAIDEQIGMSIDEFATFVRQPDPCLEIDFAALPFP
jgi:hypothetical protein